MCKKSSGILRQVLSGINQTFCSDSFTVSYFYCVSYKRLVSPYFNLELLLPSYSLSVYTPLIYCVRIYQSCRFFFSVPLKFCETTFIFVLYDSEYLSSFFTIPLNIDTHQVTFISTVKLLNLKVEVCDFYSLLIGTLFRL